MLNPRVASRYAKSILDLAIEKGQLEEVYKDMQYLQQLAKASPEFVSLMRSPVVKAWVMGLIFPWVTALIALIFRSDFTTGLRIRLTNSGLALASCCRYCIS